MSQHSTVHRIGPVYIYISIYLYLCLEMIHRQLPFISYYHSHSPYALNVLIYFLKYTHLFVNDIVLFFIYVYPCKLHELYQPLNLILFLLIFSLDHRFLFASFCSIYIQIVASQCYLLLFHSQLPPYFISNTIQWTPSCPHFIPS